MGDGFGGFFGDGPDPDHEGEYFDKLITFTLDEFMLLDSSALHRLCEMRVGTDEMGGLLIGFESLVDTDTVTLRVRGTVDCRADGSPPPGVAISEPPQAEALSATEQRLKIRRRDAVASTKRKATRYNGFKRNRKRNKRPGKSG